MQGFNMGRYTAPSTLDPTLTTDTPPSSKRRRTVTPAQPPTVRFEMPFAIWCSTCPTYSSSQLIGQGVRFNAQKKRIGNYFSTPIWSFRMKHAACGGWIEIRTDPKSSEYVVTEGARRRDMGDDLAVAGRTGGVVIGGSARPGEDAERAMAKEDAFAALEGRKEEKSRAAGEARRLDEFRSLRERDWKDADAANRKIRSTFRVGRRKRDKDAETGAVLQERMGLGIDIVAEDDDDARRAGFVEFGLVDSDVVGLEAAKKPLFEPAKTRSKVGAKVQSRTQELQQQLSGNTRAASDPFSVITGPNSTTERGRSIPGVRRKRVAEEQNPTKLVASTTQSLGPPETPTEQNATSNISLVNYDSE